MAIHVPPAFCHGLRYRLCDHSIRKMGVCVCAVTLDRCNEGRAVGLNAGRAYLRLSATLFDIRNYVVVLACVL